MTKKSRLLTISMLTFASVATGVIVPTAVVYSLDQSKNTNLVEISPEDFENIISDKDFAKDWVNENIFNNDPELVIESVKEVIVGINKNNNITLEITISKNSVDEIIHITANNLYGLEINIVIDKIINYFKSNVNKDEQYSNENIIDTLVKAYNLLNNNSLNNANAILSNPSISNNNNKIIDIFLTSNINWYFIDVQKQYVDKFMKVTNVVTNINTSTSDDENNGTINNSINVEMTSEELEQMTNSKDFIKDWFNENIFSNDNDQNSTFIDNVLDFELGINSNENITLELVIESSGIINKVDVTITNLYGINENITIQNVKEYFTKNVTIDDQYNQENILDTLNKAYECLNNKSLKSYESSISNPGTTNDHRKIIDLLLEANDNWLFVNIEDKLVSETLNIKDVITNILLASDELYDSLFNVNNFEELDNILSNNNLLLDKVNSIFGESLKANSVSTNKNYLENEDGKLSFDLTINLSNGETIEKVINTNLSIISFNNIDFINWFNNDVNDLNMVEINNFKNSLLNFMSTNSNASIDVNMFNEKFNNEYADLIKENANGISVMLFNINIELINGLCLFINDSPLQSYNLMQEFSNICPIIPSEANDHQQIFPNNVKAITIDNYKEYFEGANNFAEKDNPGRMMPEVASKLFNNLVPAGAIESIQFVKSSNRDYGKLCVDVTVNLKKPFEFNRSSTIEFKDIITGIYDPNSEYNIGLFHWANDETIDWTWFNGYKERAPHTQNRIFLPKKCKYYRPSIKEEFSSGDTWQKLWINEFNGEFATDLIDIGHQWRTFRYAKIHKFVFRNLPNFVGIINNAKSYFQQSNAKEYIFEDLPKFTYVGGVETFVSNPNLKKISFKNCPNLTWLPQDFIRYSDALEIVDFRGCNISSGHKDTFWDLQYQNITFYVDNNTTANGIKYLISCQNKPGKSKVVWGTPPW